MRQFDISAHTQFRVEVDESKFTPTFFAEFSSYMWYLDSVEEAVEHLASLFARGLIHGDENEFIEGFGPASEMGIKFIVERAGARPVSADLEFEMDVAETREKAAA